MKRIHYIGRKKFIPGLNELQRQIGIVLEPDGYQVECIRTGTGITVEIFGHNARVTYERDDQFFHAFSLAAQYVDGENRFIRVTSRFQRFGTMQSSSNCVKSVEGIKQMLRQSALMGYNYMELYTESSYEVPGEPYFGYMKGRYSQQELKELVAYANMLFVELVPSIQTLGHMQEMFKWSRYAEVRDIQATMLVDYERTYELIENMLRSLRECYTTNRINLGMDEAYFMGKGRYHWFVDDSCPDPSMLFIRHLKRVLEIAKKVGFTEPAIWFDNLFEINYKGYITPPVWLWKEFKEEITDSFPEVRLIFWNYVIRNVDDFQRYVGYIRRLSPNVSFASMAHGYTSFAPENYITAQLVDTAREGCAQTGINDLMITWWGNQLSQVALLAGYYHYIENCVQSSGYDFDDRCCFLFGYTYDELCALDLPNKIEPDCGSTGLAEGNNPPYYILADDPLLGIMSRHIPENAPEIYEKHRQILDRLAQRNVPFHYVFRFEEVLCRVLAEKSDLSRIIKTAYDQKDLQSLRRIAQEKIPKVIAREEEFCDAYRSYWHTFNKSMGWEKYERNFGGDLLRLKSVQKILLDYADGVTDRIEELEQERLPYAPNKDGRVIGVRGWNNIATTGI